MERDEFRDFLLQIDLPKETGRTLRFSLVRLTSGSLSSKLTDENYITLKTVPFRDNYRFILSSFTHSEYSKFKEDFHDQVDFLRFNPEEFRSIANIAFRYGFELDEYISSGRGKLDIRAPSKENRSEYLLKDMENRSHEGFRPYLVKMSGEKARIRIRADFNIFISRIKEKEAFLIYDITDRILSTHRELYENLSRFRNVLEERKDISLVPEKIEFSEPVQIENLNRQLSERFETVSESIAEQMHRIFLRDRPSGRWSATVNVMGKTVQILPGLEPALESMLVLRETINDLRGR